MDYIKNINCEMPIENSNNKPMTTKENSILKENNNINNKDSNNYSSLNSISIYDNKDEYNDKYIQANLKNNSSKIFDLNE